NEPSARISRVNLFVDSERMYTAGDDTGRILEKTCPWASQAMAERILSQVREVDYQPFSAADAMLDPAAELGDGITVGGVYSVLAKADVAFDGLYTADVAAPGGDEVEDEYPYKSRVQRQNDRELARIRSSITKTAERITLLVENEIDGLEGKLELTASSLTAEIKNTRDGLSSKIEQTASSLTAEIKNTRDGLSSKIEQTASSLTAEIKDTRDGLNSKIEQTASSLISQISATNGQLSSIKQYVDNITLSVSNGSTTSTITLKSGSATISSQTIQMNGLVTFSGLANGTTTIDGACIRTGTIDAEYLNLTGAIRWRDLTDSVQDEINYACIVAEDAQSLASDLDSTVSGWTYRGTTYIDGAMLMTGTVMASQLLGGYVGLLDNYEREVGNISITYTSTGYGIELSSDTGGIRINASGNFWVDAYYGSLGVTESGVVCGGDCVPLRGSRYPLGASGLNWTDVYADNDAIVTSDRNKKHDISYNLSIFDQLFSALKPVSYRLKDGASGRLHLGMIAQDVEQALFALGISTKDFAGFIKSPRLDDTGQAIDGEYDYALRYGEFIPLCIAKIQELEAQVAKLESRLAS
ncbi:MAG: tail fiber domain-containing protein, partial [Oscillospiraceae bacterium]|nr:tail fiber domain-containing protein [Oscillospiraceae bacterium]